MTDTILVRHGVTTLRLRMTGGPLPLTRELVENDIGRWIIFPDPASSIRRAGIVRSVLPGTGLVYARMGGCHSVLVPTRGAWI